MYALRFSFAALALFAAATSSAQVPASSPNPLVRPDPSAIFESCMRIEIPRMKKKIEEEGKTADPKEVAHYICVFYKNICTEKPDGNSCQNGIRKYQLGSGPG